MNSAGELRRTSKSIALPAPHPFRRTDLKAVFLDIDGVLNSTSRWDHLPSGEGKIDPKALVRVRRICEETGAKIVVSSSWRGSGRENQMLARMRRLFIKHGWQQAFAHLIVVGVTPNLNPGRDRRRNEIAQWLKEHREATSFVILDDANNMAGLSDRLVQTRRRFGLKDRHVERAIKILGRATARECPGS